MSDDLNKQDELVDIRLPRAEAEVLRKMIKREETYNNVTGMFKSSWIWVVAGGCLTLFALWDKIVMMLGVK